MDVTTLSHGIISLFIPVAWVIILYPFYTKYRFEMTRIIILTAGLSLVAIILKELFDVDASINDIVADILGIFFGTGIAVGLLHVGERFFGIDGSSDSFSRIQPDSAERETIDHSGSLHLSDALSIGVILTELGCRFYSEANENIEDVRIQRLLKTLFDEKKDTVRYLQGYKKRMRSGSVDRSTIDDIRAVTGEYPPMGEDTREQTDFTQLLDDVLTIEESLSAQYIKMEHDLSDRTGWQATPFKNLILSQRRCVDLLKKFSEGRE